MDTDTIREKYIRSEEALVRIQDDISKLIFSRLQDFKNTKEYLETLIKEKEAVDTQITDQESKIFSFKEQIASNNKSIEGAKQKQADLIHHVQMNESQLQNIEKENQTVIQSMESIKEEIEKIKKG